MFVDRTTWNVKHGCWDEAYQLMLKAKSYFDARKIPFRIYAPQFGSNDVLVTEVECENLATYEKLLPEWGTSPERIELLKVWDTVYERGGTSEGWWRKN